MSEAKIETICDLCEGTGEVMEVCNYKTTCEKCNGTGIDKVKELEKRNRKLRKCLIWILMHLREGTIRTELSINTIEEALKDE